MSRRKRPDRNPEHLLIHAQIEAAAHKGRRGTARKLRAARLAYAARVCSALAYETSGRVA